MFTPESAARFASLAAMYGAHSFVVGPDGAVEALTASGHRFAVQGEHLQFAENDEDRAVREAQEAIQAASRTVVSNDLQDTPKPGLLARLTGALGGS